LAETVTIPRRFNGPPEFGHGGYACGSVAMLVDAPVASVSLRRPPPLDTPMAVRSGGEATVTLLDGEDVVAEGEPAALDLDVPEPVSVEAARVARTRNPWLDSHPFPTCFGCGTQRDRAEAIATVLGPVEGREGLCADTWVPQTEFAGADGVVMPLFVWAALDCPSGAGAIEPGTGPHVLARLTADPGIAPVRAGDEHVVIGWLRAREGRKSWGGAALLTAQGEVCAVSEGLWIRLRDPATHGAKISRSG
jgi:hypothetical protein